MMAAMKLACLCGCMALALGGSSKFLVRRDVNPEGGKDKSAGEALKNETNEDSRAVFRREEQPVEKNNYLRSSREETLAMVERETSVADAKEVVENIEEKMANSTNAVQEGTTGTGVQANATADCDKFKTKESAAKQEEKEETPKEAPEEETAKEEGEEVVVVMGEHGDTSLPNEAWLASNDEFVLITVDPGFAVNWFGIGDKFYYFEELDHRSYIRTRHGEHIQVLDGESVVNEMEIDVKKGRTQTAF